MVRLNHFIKGSWNKSGGKSWRCGFVVAIVTFVIIVVVVIVLKVFGAQEINNKKSLAKEWEITIFYCHVHFHFHLLPQWQKKSLYFHIPPVLSNY